MTDIRSTLRCLALCLVGATLTACVPEPAVTRPGEEHALLASSGAWCWFGDPRGLRFQGERNRVYAGWVDSSGSIAVSSLDLETGESAESEVHPNFNRDDHANPSLLSLPDGTIVVFYTSHGSDVSEAMYYRISQRPEDVTSWSDRYEIGTNTVGPRGHTYPNPVRLSEEGGRIYLFWRGGNFKPSFSYTDDLETWAPAQTLIQSNDSTVVRPYVKIASDGLGTIHFAFTDGHPRNEPLNSIYYIRYQGGNFTRADGSIVGTMTDLPLIHQRADLVYDGRVTGVRSWIWDVAADDQGNPVVVYTRLPEETDHRYHYARWNGEQWLDIEITDAGGWFPHTPEGITEPEPHYSGGIVLNHGNPAEVYLSRPVEGKFEIERWWTPDEGANWHSASVTAGSQNDNVRPYVVRAGAGSSPLVLWMENRRYRHYLDYDSSIRIDGFDR